MLDKNTIQETLKSVKYPGFSRDIVSFGLVKDILIDDGAVTVRLELTAGSEEVARRIKADGEAALASVEGVRQATVNVVHHAPSAGGGLPGQNRVPGIQRIIAVASGKGGVGKSTISANLACALHHLGAKVGLLDCDIYGPSIPLMMGAQRERPALDANEQIIPLNRHGIKLMSMGFLVDDDAPVIWRGPLIVKTIQQFFHSVAWGELEYLLVDLPPGTGDAQLTLCQTVPLDGGVIVTTPQEASLGVVRKGAVMFEKVNVPILGLIENMSYYITPSGDRVEIFGHGGGRQEADRRQVAFLGEIPIFTEIREAGDRGVPVVVESPEKAPGKAFLEVAKNLTARLATPA